MSHVRRQRWQCAALLVGLVALSIPGCKATGCKDGKCNHPEGKHTATCMIDNCADIPSGSLPAPLGTHVRSFQHAQTTKARGDSFVIYEKEWVSSNSDPKEFSTQLGPDGIRHLKQLVDALPGVEGPIVLEPTSNRKLGPDQRMELDERRYQQVVNQLGMEGVANPENRVIVAYSQAEGLYGDESPRVYARTIYPGFMGNGMGGGLGYGQGLGTGMNGAGGMGGYGGMGGIMGGALGPMR